MVLTLTKKLTACSLASKKSCEQFESVKLHPQWEKGRVMGDNYWGLINLQNA
jgi:hypothetical protein